MPSLQLGGNVLQRERVGLGHAVFESRVSPAANTPVVENSVKRGRQHIRQVVRLGHQRRQSADTSFQIGIHLLPVSRAVKSNTRNEYKEPKQHEGAELLHRRTSLLGVN